MEFGTIGITEAQIDMLNSAESFCRDKSPMEKVRALMKTDLGYDEAVWDEIGALGWLGIAIPEEYGGVGLSMTEVVPVMEQMGRRMMHTPFMATTLAWPYLKRTGIGILPILTLKPRHPKRGIRCLG